MELCKKDLDYVGRSEADAVKDVKKTPNMKLPLHFYSTFEKVRGAGSSHVLPHSSLLSASCCNADYDYSGHARLTDHAVNGAMLVHPRCGSYTLKV